MITSVARGVLAIGVVWLIIKVLKRFLGKSSLDNLPGPPGGSFLAGKLYWWITLLVCSLLHSGHFDELNNPDAWEYHKQLAANCKSNSYSQMSAHYVALVAHQAFTDGSVVKLRGAFGGKALFVYDPKALHHIIVKDQPIFEETNGFML